MKISEAAKINHDIAMIHSGHDGMPNGLRYIEKLLSKHDSETRELREALKKIIALQPVMGTHVIEVVDIAKFALSKAGAE